MLRVKRMICILLLVVMTVSLLPKEALAMSVVTPSLNGVTNSKNFTALPGVYEMGDGYAVIWATSFKGTGYIKYTYQGQSYTVYDQRNGIVRTNDTVHVVKVPHEHLQGNSYTVYSREVTGHHYALTYYGTTISAGPITLKAYDGGTNTFDVLVLTDTHKKLDWTVAAAKQFSQDPDLVVFSGDIVDSIESMSDIALMFNIMGTTTGGRYPIIYCRGNHETRGVYSTKLLDYFPTETGEFYFDFRYGPLWGVVMDTGEDKEDSHEYYGNLANYKEYNRKQEAWLRSLRMDTTATFRFAIHHIPQIGSLANGIDFSDSIAHLGLQFGVGGHDHRCGTSSGSNYTTYICGGYSANAATLVTLNNSAKKAYVTSKSSTGTVNSSYNNYGISLSSKVGSVPSALTEPDYGTHAQFNPSASPAGTISISVPPTVFETGGDWYNVVWVTHSTSSTAKGSTGYVEYTYNGKTYQQFDQAGGYRTVSSPVHTVKVPKEHLNNNTYKVGSFLVNYSYTNPTAQTGRYYSSGDYVESQEYVFENKTGDEAVNLVICPDIKTNDGDTNGYAAAAASAVAGLGTSATYVVINGDAVEVALYTIGDLAVLFSATARVSGGNHPVIFSRGNSECRGYYATELIKYIPTVTGEFYYSLDVGDYTLVNIDTGEDDPDSATAVVNGSTVSKYDGRLFHNNLRQQQLNWIHSLSSGKLVAISHIPFATVKSRFSLDYETALKNKGAVLAIGGHNNKYSLKETVNSSNIYTIIPGGSTGTRTNSSASVLLSDQYAYLDTCQYANGSTSHLATKTVSLTSGSALSCSAVQPPLSGSVYTVSTANHLKWISQNCSSASSFSGYTFKLANDIDLQLVPFTPIGGNDSSSSDSNTSSKGFAGTFDGNGYTIRNLNIDSAYNNVGLFGVVRKGTVKNLKVSTGCVDGGWFVGGVAGYSYGGTFENCYSDLIVNSSSGSKVGGLVGFLSHGSQINCCANYGSVSVYHSGGSVGGLAGQLYSATRNYISSSYNRGSIAAPGASGLAGGIFGYAGSISATIQNCYNAAAVASPGSEGAVFASCSSSGTILISNCYFTTGYNGATTALRGSNYWSTASGSGTIESRSQSAMKSQAAAELLSAADYSYIASENDGYPVHRKSLHGSGTSHNYTAQVIAPTCTTGGYTRYTCSCGDSYTANETAAYGHSYVTTTTNATCTTIGKTVTTCTSCGDQNFAVIPATGHNYCFGTCSRCGSVDSGYVAPTYYLFGYINGANYGCEEDYATIGKYQFVNGKLTTIFSTGSYVAVKTDDNGSWYMTKGWEGMDATSVTLYRSDTLGSAADKFYIPANLYLTFTLTENPDGSLTLSYAPTACNHNYQCTARTEATCTTAGAATYQCSTCWDSYTETFAATGHHYIWGTCASCGLVDSSYVKPNYYLFGYINGSNYACEENYEDMGSYLFVNDQLTTIFTEDSYVGVKAEGNAAWYMTDGWQGFDRTSVTLYNTASVSNADRLYVPANLYVTFTMTENADGSVTLSYAPTACNHNYECTILTPVTCTTGGEASYRCSICWDTYTRTIPATGHHYVWGSCEHCGLVDETYVEPEYYLFGWINGADYASEGDYQNMGIYKFVNGKLITSFTMDSYVGVKTEGNGIWYMTNGWLGDGVTSAKLYDTTTNIIADKLAVPGDTHLIFTLTQNADATLTLSYEIGSHSYAAAVTDPTCTQGGYTTFTCACGDTYVGAETSALGHRNHTTTVNATCTQSGSRTDTCQRCGNVQVQVLPATGHRYVSTVTAPTCTEAGYTTYSCPCGDVYNADATPATGHSYEAFITAPTCTEDGYTTYICFCGSSYTANATVSLGHSYKTVTVDATCTKAGSKTKTCKICGDVVTQTIPATGHSYEAFITAPTCTEDGYTTYICFCGSSYTANVTVSPGHSYKTVTVDATCTKAGRKTETCETCGDVVTQIIPATGHSYEAVVTAPTCTEDGYTTYTCFCGSSYTANVTVSPGHSYKTVTVDATCTKAGRKTETCESCGDVVTQIIPATGHSYEAVVTAPTCTEDGYTTYTCFCGSSYTANVTVSLGHSYENGRCIRCSSKDPNYTTEPSIQLKYPTLVFEDEILMNVYFSAENLEDVREMGLVIYDAPVDDWSLDNASAIIPGYTWNETDGLYYATTQGIAAKCLGDTIYFAVYACLTDGSTCYTSLISYSPKTYAYHLLETADTEMKALVVAMLNYGAAAQTYFSYNTNALVDADLTASQLSLVEDYRSSMVSTVTQPSASKLGQMKNNGGYSKRYPTVSFEGAFHINYYFVPSAAPVGQITMYVWNQADYEGAATLSKGNATQAITMELTETGEYLAVVEDIAAKDLDQGIYVSFCYWDGTTNYCSGVVGYSIGTYCKSQAARTDSMADLAAACAVYSYYAKQLFN